MSITDLGQRDENGWNMSLTCVGTLLLHIHVNVHPYIRVKDKSEDIKDLELQETKETRTHT